MKFSKNNYQPLKPIIWWINALNWFQIKNNNIKNKVILVYKDNQNKSKQILKVKNNHHQEKSTNLFSH